MTSQRPRELIAALVAVIFFTLAYLSMNVILGKAPAASSFYGHSLGIVGFILMLMTETLYSLRKRSRLARWGRMSSWLQFHIFTGIVGPFLVLLHSSWKFNGVAGVLTLLTGVIVLSGFIGRYIYTSVPRTADGLVVEMEELERQIALLDTRVEQLRGPHPLPEAALPGPAGALRAANAPGPGADTQPVERRTWLDRAGRDPTARREGRELNQLLRRQKELRRQAGSLQSARRLLATWHAVHIPIGLALFALALVHVAAAIYFAELM